MRELCHPEVHDIKLALVLHALGDPVRLRIVRSLATEGDNKCVHIEVPVSKSTASHHFRILREAGVIWMRARGRCYVNSLRREDLDHLFPGLLDSVLAAVCSRAPGSAVLRVGGTFPVEGPEQEGTNRGKG